MLNLGTILLYLFEGVAITIAIYLISKKQLAVAEVVTLSLTIAVTFMVLDLFAPEVGSSARQGTGFGLGFKQIGGNSNPGLYYGSKGCPTGKCGQKGNILEGMDDPVAIEYYQRWNPPYQPNNLPPALNTKEIYTGTSDDMSNMKDNVPEGQTAQVYNATQYEPALPINNKHMQLGQQAEITPEGASRQEGYSNYKGSQYVQPQEVGQMGEVGQLNQKGEIITSPIAKKIRNNPFATTVRSYTEIDRPGAYYKTDNIPKIIGETAPMPILYSPLKPSYGYRYELPSGWDKLQQPELYKALNAFKNSPPDVIACQARAFAPKEQYVQNYEHQKKNV